MALALAIGPLRCELNLRWGEQQQDELRVMDHLQPVDVPGLEIDAEDSWDQLGFRSP
jgi:hypothetical protein